MGLEGVQGVRGGVVVVLERVEARQGVGGCRGAQGKQEGIGSSPAKTPFASAAPLYRWCPVPGFLSNVIKPFPPRVRDWGGGSSAIFDLYVRFFLPHTASFFAHTAATLLLLLGR